MRLERSNKHLHFIVLIEKMYIKKVFFFLNVYSRIMKFFVTGSFLFVAFAVFATAEEWAWSKDKSTNKDSVKPVEADSDINRESKSIDSYSEANDNSNSQEEGGASVASLSGNETDSQARHVIRDRLCGLGLMEVTINYI